VDDYFNRAQLQVALDIPHAFETVWKDSLVEDQREYTLPDSFYQVDHVRFIASSPAATVRTDVRRLEGVSMEEYKRWIMRDEDNTGQPAAYYFWRKLGQDGDDAQQPPSIYLHPTPGADEVDTDNLEVWGYKYPDEIDSTGGAPAPTTTVELEPAYIEAAIMYAAHLMMADDNDMARSDRFLVRYREQIEKSLGAMSRRDRGDFQQILPKGARRNQYRYGRGVPIRW
jgi:hypothetical protein